MPHCLFSRSSCFVFQCVDFFLIKFNSFCSQSRSLFHFFIFLFFPADGEDVALLVLKVFIVCPYVCVCVRVCVCMCVYVCVHTHIPNAGIYTDTCTHMCVYVCLYMPALGMCARMCVYVSCI